MNDEVRAQILAIRDSGETNMFDVCMVERIALREGYNELLIYLSDHRQAYAQFILTGRTED